MNYHFAGFCTSIGLWFHPSHFHTLCEFKFNWLEPVKTKSNERTVNKGW